MGQAISTQKARLKHVGEKLTKLSKWLILSGAATYLLTELTTVVEKVSWGDNTKLFIFLVIDVCAYAVAQYIVGPKKETK